MGHRHAYVTINQMFDTKKKEKSHKNCHNQGVIYKHTWKIENLANYLICPQDKIQNRKNPIHFAKEINGIKLKN